MGSGWDDMTLDLKLTCVDRTHHSRTTRFMGILDVGEGWGDIAEEGAP